MLDLLSARPVRIMTGLSGGAAVSPGFRIRIKSNPVFEGISRSIRKKSDGPLPMMAYQMVDNRVTASADPWNPRQDSGGKGRSRTYRACGPHAPTGLKPAPVTGQVASPPLSLSIRSRHASGVRCYPPILDH